MTMLDRMRRHKGWLKWSLALVVLTFVVFYIPDFLTTSTGASPSEVLAEVGLWLEDPRWTFDPKGDHWVHLQTVPPRSGNRVFVPSDAPAKDPDFPVTWA